MAANVNYVLDRIKALEGWSIKIHKAIKMEDFEEALSDLKNERYEGRRLEWRGQGLRGLPDEHTSVPKLKKMISSIRAASKQITPFVEKARDLKKRSADSQSTLRIKLLKDKATPLVVSMMNEAKAARALAENKPWDWKFGKEKEALIMMLKRKGYYKKLSDQELIETTKKIDFENVWISLAGADLSGAKLNGVHFPRANLFKVNFSGAKLIGANLARANLSGSNFSKADLSGADLTLAKVSLISLKEFKAGLYSADFHSANLSGANLTKVSFPSTNFAGANLSNADLTEALIGGGLPPNFSHVNFSGANLRSTVFIETNLSHANFSSGTKVHWTNLSKANLSEAILSGGDFYQPMFYGTNLETAKITAPELKALIKTVGFQHDKNTRWPKR